MIKYSLLLLICFALFCCKKKDDAPNDSTQPIAPTSSINFYVTTYDSLGDIENNSANVSINLYQTSFSAVTTTAGYASISNLPYNSYVPILNKTGYDYPPISISVNNANAVTANLPFPKLSPYKMDTLIGQKVNQDSITLTFNLSKPIPLGKSVKLAVITGTNNGLNPNDFKSIDIVNLTNSNIVKLNVAKLPNLVAAIATLTNTNFYVNAIPVTYGAYNSNIFNRQVLLGDNIYYKNNLVFLKNW